MSERWVVAVSPSPRVATVVVFVGDYDTCLSIAKQHVWQRWGELTKRQDDGGLIHRYVHSTGEAGDSICAYVYPAKDL